MRVIKLLFLSFFITLSAVNTSKAASYISYFGEAKYQEGFSHFAYANPNAPKSGSITFAAIGSFDSLQPFILSGTSADGLSNTYDTLLTRSLDELSTYYGLLAEDIEINYEENSVSFRLRKIAKWHDGQDITSNDILFSYQTLKDKGHPRYRIQLKNILTAEIINKHEIKFFLPDVQNKDLIFLLGSLPIISKQYYQTYEFDKPSQEAFLGSGPYKVKDFKSGKYITYERVDNYWGKNLAVNQGRYNFEQIKYKYYRDNTVAVMALKAGEYDLRSENIAKNWANEYNIPEVENNSIIKEEIAHQIPTGMQAFVLNNRLAKFQNKNLREALNLAFDFEWTNKNLFFSAYKRTNSYFSNSLFAAKPNITSEELALIKSLNLKDVNIHELTNIKNPETDGTGNNRNNLLKAVKLLEEAGYYLKDMKLYDPKSNKPVSFEFLTVSPSFKRVILPYIRNLSKLGIDAEIKLVDFSIYQKRLENFDFEITVSVFPGSSIPGNEQLSFWHSKSSIEAGSNNLIGVNDPNIDKIVTKISNASDLQELQNLTSLLDRLLLSSYYVIPHWNINAFRLIYWNKFGKTETNPPYGLAIDYWWIK